MKCRALVNVEGPGFCEKGNEWGVGGWPAGSVTSREVIGTSLNVVNKHNLNSFQSFVCIH